MSSMGRLPVSDKPERCPNLNSAHTNQKTFSPPQQRFDSPSAAVQCGDSSEFVFRSESRPSGCFLSNHPVSHKAITLKAIAEARTIEARATPRLAAPQKILDAGAMHRSTQSAILTGE